MGWQNRSLPEIRAAKEHFAASLLELPGVVGIGIGRKIRGGVPMRALALRIYVKEKKPLRNLRKSLRFPIELQFFSRNRRNQAPKGIGIDLVEVGSEFVPCQAPLTMGESASLASPRRYNDGTMGAILKDQNGNHYLLSNNHVLADVNDAPIGSQVIHPSKREGGGLPADLVGRLARFVPIRSIGGNEVDAAIVSIPGGTTVVQDIGRVSAMAPTPAEGGSCKLFRRTIGQVEDGSVFDRDVFSKRITYENPTVGASFNHLILLNIKVDRGDSGSLVVDSSNRAFGLVMGKSDLDFALVCPLKRVLELLGSRHTSTGTTDLALRLA